jgi:hypothetical protein
MEFGKLATEPLSKRPSKVSPKDFAKPWKRGKKFKDFIDTLPKILAGEEFRKLVDALHKAKKKRKPILWGLGGHVIKTGLSPILADLMQKGYVQGIATAGAALVHDFEIALAGKTSEDVEAQLGKGKFGMAEETGTLLNKLAVWAHRENIGLGEAVGHYLATGEPGGTAPAKFGEVSLLAQSYQHKVPFCVHLAIGTDIFHVHPGADGAALGASSHHDFRLFCSLVQGLDKGGVYINLGSAVILPEVFLKAVSVVRGKKKPLGGFTTANLDFMQHYRPTQNVLQRPAKALKAQAISLTGHHEILLPLLAAALLERG